MAANTARQSRNQSSADFQVGCRRRAGALWRAAGIAGFQTRTPHNVARAADLEIGDTAGLETCATVLAGLAEKFARESKTFTDSSTKAFDAAIVTQKIRGTHAF